MKNANKHRILIVEDEPTLNKSYQKILQSAGYTVDAAYDGEAALSAAGLHEPALILLDIRMPGMDGLEFLQKYQPAKHPGVTVIVFSNYDDQDQIDGAYKLGADRYILKTWLSARELLQIAANSLA